MNHLPESKVSLSSAEKRALLAKLLQEKVSQKNKEKSLSYNQKSLWYIHQSASDSAAYNVAFSARICSELNVYALKRAFQKLIDRHAILRTTYSTANGRPIQIIHKDQQISFETTDSSVWTFEQLNQHVIQAYRAPFDLEQGPIIRINLFSHAADDHVLLVTIHHIAYDGWSHWVILNELKLLYLSEVDSISPELSPLSQQYTDYLDWQTKMLAGPEGEKLWQYWEQTLSGDLPVLNLPTDHPRKTQLDYEGSSHLFKISPSQTLNLKAFAQKEGATLYMLLVAAFNVFLSRYTGQDDILIGSPTSGRNQVEFSEVVGNFVNPIVIRESVADNPTFTDFLARIRSTVLHALEHQEYPFPLLVERLRPDRDSSRSPIFQVLFNYLKPQNVGEVTSLLIPNDEISQVDWAGLQLESFPLAQQEGQYDLDLEIFETEDLLVGIFNYKSDLFDASTITRMAENFQALLDSIVIDSEQQLQNVSILSSREQHQLLMEWNPQEVYEEQQCYHQLFEKQVSQTPNSLAVIHQEQQLTYRELDSQANQLAHYLRSLNIGPDRIVGICVERSLEMAVGFLGIFKSGGAYLPLDPKYPSERLAFMIEDSQTPIILTQKKLVGILPPHNAQVICLDEDWPEIANYSQETPANITTKDNLAYVIYTSGSTGKPKGVMIPHRGLVNHNLAMAKQFDLKAKDRVLQFASISFDIAVEELFPTWLKGAAIVLRPDEILSSIEDFIAFVSDQSISILNFPTAFWHEMVNGMQQLQCDLPQAVRLVVVGGEKASRSIYQTWLTMVGDRCRWLNTYGPTETSVTATAYEPGVEMEGDSNTTEIPIGRPIDNVQIYVLDQQLQPVPIGVPGELHIGGAGVARGYLNRPELSDEKFISHPFSQNPNAKLYKTGDLVYYRPDGNIMFLGRGDDQVKIRGFRIELGEIESALEQHPDIKEAVILAREDQPGDKRLVAYVVVDQAQLGTADIRRYLKERLPIYMVPSAFVMLEVLPLTPNGKVDRRSLPAPDLSRVEQDETFVAPRNEMEQQLADIWSKVLRLEKIGVYDNFFELGGDSILSIQIITRASQAGLKLTPKQLFQYQTIAELATVADPSNLTDPIQAEQSLIEGEVPLTPIQQWFFAENFPEPHHYNQSMMFDVPLNLEVPHVEQVIQHLLVHHDALRLRFTQDSHENWQQVNSGINEASVDGVLPFTVIDLTALSGAEQKQAIASHADALQAGLDLASGSMLKLALFKLGNGQADCLLIVIHHLAVDGVSWRILLEDFTTAYQQLQAGKTIQLPPKTTSFKDWAEQLVDYGRSEGHISRLEYWQRLAQFEVSPLPTDHPFKKEFNAENSAITVSCSLDQHDTQSLLKEVPKAYNTQINDVLLSAFVQSFALWTGEKSLLIDLEGHGREELFENVDLSRTVGWFTSVFPVLLNLANTEEPGEVLKSVKEQLRQIPNKGIDYGIQRYLGQDADIQAQLLSLPLVEVCFNYLGQFDQVLFEAPLLGESVERKGKEHSPKGQLTYLIEMNSFVSEGKLQTKWTFSDTVFDQSTIENLAQGFVDSLLSLITHCQSSEAGGYTPSDFAEAHLNQQDLDQILEGIHQKHSGVSQSQAKKNIEALYPLSPSQQGILFECLSAPESGVHLEQTTWTLKGAWDFGAFERAWQRAIDRQSILRTGFIWDKRGEPLQFVLKQMPVSIERQDWRGLSSSEQEAKLKHYLQSDRIQGLDLSIAPLMRFVVFEMGENDYQFLWTHHHIQIDGWCSPLILKEVLDFYEAFTKQQNLILEPSRPFRDYISWLKHQDLSQAEQFWQHKLKDFTEPTSPGQVVEVANIPDLQEQYGKQIACLPDDVTSALQSLARKHRLTFNTLIQGVWALMLSCYSGESDVLFGATVSGRPPTLDKVESMIGLFINTLPMRVAIASDASLWPWLQALQSENLEQKDYEYCSAGQVHQWSEVPGSRALYESILVFENYPVDSSVLSSEGLAIELCHEYSRGAQTKHPLTILVIPGAELHFHIVFDQQRFDVADICKIQGHFLSLLTRVASESQPTLADLLTIIPADDIPQVKAAQTSSHNVQARQDEFVEHRDDLELKLKDIWEKVLGIYPISIRDNFFELGGYSLLAVSLFQEIENSLDLNLPLSSLLQAPTIEQFAETLRQQGGATAWSSLVPINAQGTKPPLFCIHGGGFNVLIYHDLAQHLGPDYPVYGIQAQGLDGSTIIHGSFEEMATDYIEHLKTVQPEGPYFLSGVSAGGVIALEMAQQLQAQGQEVAIVAMFDTSGPDNEGKVLSPIPRFFSVLQYVFNYTLPRFIDKRMQHGPKALIADVFQEIKKLAKKKGQQQQTEESVTLAFESDVSKTIDELPDDMNALESWVHHFHLWVLRRSQLAYAAPEVEVLGRGGSFAEVAERLKAAHHQAWLAYECKPYPGAITVFKANEQLPGFFDDPHMGWGSIAQGGVKIHLVPGYHADLVRSSDLAKGMKECIDRFD